MDSFTYLGVNIDYGLNFESFLNDTISRVNGRLITFARIRKLPDVKTSELIYKQTISPILDYVSTVCNSSTQQRIVKLQPLHNHAIRIIERCTGYISTEDMKKLHVEHNLKMLHDRRKLSMLKIMYKLSQEAENVNTYRPEVMLRTGPKVKMKIDFTDKLIKIGYAEVLTICVIRCGISLIVMVSGRILYMFLRNIWKN